MGLAVCHRRTLRGVSDRRNLLLSLVLRGNAHRSSSVRQHHSTRAADFAACFRCRILLQDLAGLLVGLLSLGLWIGSLLRAPLLPPVSVGGIKECAAPRDLDLLLLFLAVLFGLLGVHLSLLVSGPLAVLLLLVSATWCSCKR